MDVTGLLDHRMMHSETAKCSLFPRSWDIKFADFGLLLRCRFRDFQFRRERRMFDMVDTHNTGFVTLDELIQFRDRLRIEGAQLDTEMFGMQNGHHAPDLSKSLLALYHFDVARDGHFTFEEFLLLQAYLQDMEHDNDGAVVCRCIPKNWLKYSWLRRKLKILSNKVKKGNCKKEMAGPEGPEEEQPLASPEMHSKKGVRFDGEERVLTRRVNEHGELHEITCDDLEMSIQQSNSELDEFLPSTPGGEGRNVGWGTPHTPASPMSTRGESAPSVLRWGTSMSGSYSDNEEEEEEEDQEDQEFFAAQEEKKKNRRAMLVQALKSNKGRKKFIDWLYRLADTTESDNITMDELVTFLKAIHADGINPEVFVDPSEDYGHDDDMPTCAQAIPSRSPDKIVTGEAVSPGTSDKLLGDAPLSHEFPGAAASRVGSPKIPKRRDVLDKQHPRYLNLVGSRIMMRYNESHSGSLSREEFMQLATMIEREYELSDVNFSAAERVGPYRFIRTLGKGAEGVVKLAINSDDESLGKRAVKIIKRGNIACLARIDREIEAMVLLEHPTVVACVEVLETESSICLVMEYCAGGHIEDYISPTRPMTESAARFYFTQLIDGLSYCHEQCVCHRDLRIENLMLDNKGDLKITDFGHAGIFQQGWDVFQTMLVGSLSHLAPEQVLGTVYSGEKIDMWSVGVILYIMITGTAPFRGDTVEELLDNIKEAKYVPIDDPEVADEIRVILASTMRVDYNERPGCQQIKKLPFMKGSREKLVLAHSEFFISQPKTQKDKFLDRIRICLEDADTVVRDPKTTHHKTGEEEEVASGFKWEETSTIKPDTGNEIKNVVFAEALQKKRDFTVAELSQFGVSNLSYSSYIEVDGTYFRPAEEAEEVEATVRTVSDDEDIQRSHATGMRPVSVTVFHCVHRTHPLVFKVLVTMLSKDGGVTKLYPLVEFDLQSGDAGSFQRIFRKVRGRWSKETQNAAHMGYTEVLVYDDEHEEVPLAAFAAATGLNRASSYAKLVKPDGKCQEGFLNNSFRGSCNNLVRGGSEGVKKSYLGAASGNLPRSNSVDSPR